MMEDPTFYNRRFRLVCSLPGEEILPPPVLAVRLDTRGAALCCDPVLPHHPKHVPGVG